jgi:hypothetical protein
MYEDQGFLAKLYLIAPVFFSDRVWLSYRQHEESCVAEVVRGGRYHEVRLYFLNWLQGYLAARGNVDARVMRVVRRALWNYRHPTIHSISREFGRFPQRARQLARRVKRVALSFAP